MTRRGKPIDSWTGITVAELIQILVTATELPYKLQVARVT